MGKDKAGKGVGLPSRNDLWPPHKPADRDWRYLVEEVDGEREGREAWNLNPDYQRGNVWTDQQAERFIGHMLEGGQVPLIYVQRYDSPKNAPDGVDYFSLPIEVVDGQQRIRAICRFMHGEIAGELTDGRRVFYRDFNEVERRMIPSVRIAYIDIDRLTRLRFYVRLNRGGTVHTDEEINKVRELIKSEES